MKKETKAIAVAKRTASVFNAIKEKARQMAETASKARTAQGVALFLLSVFIWHIGSAGHAMSCALYIFANDGKVSGRMSGDVKMRNGRQRGFTVPSLVRNAYTSVVRSRFQGLSSSYRGLDPTDIATWANAVGYTYIDRFAVSHILKGKGLYIRLNSNLINAGMSPISTAPLATGVSPVEVQPAGTAITISIAGSEMSVPFTSTPVPADQAVLVFATTSLNLGISRPGNSAFRQIDVIASGSGSPQAEYVKYVAKFGVPTLGAQIFFRFITINTITGEASAISQSQGAIVGA